MYNLAADERTRRHPCTMIETMHHHRHQFHSQAMAHHHHHQTSARCYNEMQQVVLPSMTINRESKTPYSDATQVRLLFFMRLFGKT